MNDRPPLVPDVGPSQHDMREALHLAADWAASYLHGAERYPVLARTAPGW